MAIAFQVRLTVPKSINELTAGGRGLWAGRELASQEFLRGRLRMRSRQSKRSEKNARSGIGGSKDGQRSVEWASGAGRTALITARRVRRLRAAISSVGAKVLTNAPEPEFPAEAAGNGAAAKKQQTPAIGKRQSPALLGAAWRRVLPRSGGRLCECRKQEKRAGARFPISS